VAARAPEREGLALMAMAPRDSPSRLSVIPKDIEPFVIGIWRFREARRRRQWYATYVYRGHYYDAVGGDRPEDAVAAIRRGLQRLRNRTR
jgi:hypothetical protein